MAAGSHESHRPSPSPIPKGNEKNGGVRATGLRTGGRRKATATLRRRLTPLFRPISLLLIDVAGSVSVWRRSEAVCRTYGLIQSCTLFTLSVCM